MPMEKKVYKVILLNGTGEQGKWILRQTPGGLGFSDCGKYRFYVNEFIDDPDFVVVRGKSFKKPLTLNVAPENIVLTTSEPLPVLDYPADYRHQFGLVCSCQEGMKHKNVMFVPPILPWYAGALFNKNGSGQVLVDYDRFKSMPFPEKTKLVSVISSDKAFTKGHLDRIRFIDKLKARYGSKVDFYGRGFCGFGDKLEVLAPYKYHIVIENSCSKYYWTEKLSDCYMAGTYPIYHGCSNVGDYFPEGSYTAVNINNFEDTARVIDSLLESDVYEKSIPLLQECKEKVLGEYNMFNIIARCLDTLDPERPRKQVVLEPAHSMHSWRNAFNYTVGHNYYKCSYSLYKKFRKK